MRWFPHVLILYSAGSLAALLTVTMQEMGRYFFKFIALVALLLCLAGLIGYGENLVRGDLLSAGTIIYGASVFLFTVLVRFATEPWIRRALWGVLGIALGYLAVYVREVSSDDPFHAALLGVHYLTAALMLGVPLVTMILGHWYLVNASLSFDILKRCVRVVLAIVGAKFVLSAALLIVYGGRLMSPYQTDFTLLLAGVRVLVGLLGAFVLGIMIYKCARIHSNQSATGIMYVQTVFVLMGEMASMYLTSVPAIPF